MKTSTVPFNSGHRAKRQIAFFFSLAATALATTGVKAQVLVTDVTSNAQTAAISAFQQGAEYAKSVEQAVTLANQLQQMISSINNIISNPLSSLIPTTTTMNELSPDTIQALIQAKCNPGGGSGNIVASALGAAVQAMDLNNSFAKQQQVNCGNIVYAQADQYNATADLYQQVPALHNSMSAVTGLMTQISNFGDSNKATSQSTTLSNQQQQVIMEWTARVKMDQGIIDSLNQQQSMLATALFNSRPSLVGNIVQATALAGAFAIDQ